MSVFSRHQKRAVKVTLRLLFAASLAIFSGCVLLEPTESGVSQTRRAARERPADQRLPHPLPGPLTLETALRIALEHNPDLRAFHWEDAAAQARAEMAASSRWPSLHAIAGYSQLLNAQFLIPPTSNLQPRVFTDNLVAADLVMQVPLFTGGRITNEIRAADLLHEAAGQRLARSREQLTFNVTSLFYAILAQRHVIESLQFSREALDEHLKRVNDLLAAQRAADVDRLRTEVRLADLKQQLVREQNRLAIHRIALGTLLGLDETNEPLAVVGTLDFDAAATPPPLTESLAAAYEFRNDYLAALAALEAQAREVDVARAAHWPTVALLGSYGGRWAIDPAEQPAGTSRADDIGMVGVAVNVPIFEGGRISARTREETAQLHVARERLRQLELAVRLDVESALLNVTSSRERVLATEKAVEQAKESLRIERDKYDAGKGSITDVLDAQSALLDSQTNYYRALAENRTALAQLDLALGGRT